MSDKRLKLVVDFDGVIHSYENGWQGVDVFGGIVDGARYVLNKFYRDGWVIILNTCRLDSEALRNWLAGNGIAFVYINTTEFNPPDSSHKPSGTVYVDDRDWRQGGKQFTKRTWFQLYSKVSSQYKTGEYGPDHDHGM